LPLDPTGAQLSDPHYGPHFSSRNISGTICEISRASLIYDNSGASDENIFLLVILRTLHSVAGLLEVNAALQTPLSLFAEFWQYCAWCACVFYQVNDKRCRHYIEVSVELSSATTICTQTREFVLCAAF